MMLFKRDKSFNIRMLNKVAHLHGILVKDSLGK